MAEVELEWGGQTFRDEVEGETGAAVELRLAAQATLRALEAILNGRMQFALVGIKSFRAFDTDVVVVLLRTENVNAAHRRLAGHRRPVPLRRAGRAQRHQPRAGQLPDATPKWTDG